MVFLYQQTQLPSNTYIGRNGFKAGEQMVGRRGGGDNNNNNRLDGKDMGGGTIERVNDRILPTCLLMVISPVSVSRQRMTEKKK